MRIAITSRIFEPEPSAASFRLAALAAAFAGRGDDVTVLTVRPPASHPSPEPGAGRPGYRVARFPVLRDRAGYVRGYVQYMSFDIPLFFRVLFGPRRELIVCEPPPTSGFFVRLAAALRRTPYAYYAADIWADASAQTGAPGWMVGLVSRIERFALKGARVVLSVSDGVTARLAELGVAGIVVTVGNGVDAPRFAGALRSTPEPEADGRLVFVYAGTASEWHGADVFVEAMPAVLREVPEARLRFIGGGSERDALEARAAELGIAHAVSFEPVMSAEQVAPILQGAAAAVASVRPGAGYDFAFPTKLYSAAVCGAPLIHSGPGPAVDFVRTEVDDAPLGAAVTDDPAAAAEAMIEVARRPFDAERRRRVSEWAQQNVSLGAVAERAVRRLVSAVQR
ncbi:glycosyltransferase family 4 protein [Leucobacter celer]|uniref:glycosyltransferase family 4 protein n=1 Tax=Leucobacter celer TaxID=668625 RepID=UPI0006A7B3AF|nr:glycosyltransferase family 4 protein [Leucobacter celer]